MAWDTPDVEEEGLSIGRALRGFLRRSDTRWSEWTREERVHVTQRFVDSLTSSLDLPEVIVEAADEATRAELAAGGRNVRIDPKGAVEPRHADSFEWLQKQLRANGYDLSRFDLARVERELPRVTRAVIDLDGDVDRLPAALREVAEGLGGPQTSGSAAVLEEAFARELRGTHGAAEGPRGYLDVPVQPRPAAGRDEIVRLMAEEPSAAEAGRRAADQVRSRLALFAPSQPWEEIPADDRIVLITDSISDAAKEFTGINVMVHSARREEQRMLRSAHEVAQVISSDELTARYRTLFDEIAVKTIESSRDAGIRERAMSDLAARRMGPGRAPMHAIVFDTRNLQGDVDRIALGLQGAMKAITGSAAFATAYAAAFAEEVGLGDSFSPAELGDSVPSDLSRLNIWISEHQEDVALLDELGRLGSPATVEGSVSKEPQNIDLAALRQIDPEAVDRIAAAHDALVQTDMFWIKRLGVAGEAATLRQLEQQGIAGTDLNDMPSVGVGANFPLLDTMSGAGFDSVKVKSDLKLRSYARDFHRLLDVRASTRAAEALLDERNTATLDDMVARGAWPAGLARDPEAVAEYIRESARLSIPDDHVPEVQAFLRERIAAHPGSYGLPEGRTPSDAEIDGLVERVVPCGIPSEIIYKLAPSPVGPPTADVASLAAESGQVAQPHEVGAYEAGTVDEVAHDAGAAPAGKGVGSPYDVDDSGTGKVAEAPQEVGKSEAGDAGESPSGMDDSAAGKVEAAHDIGEPATGEAAPSPYDVDDSAAGKVAEAPREVGKPAAGEATPFQYDVDDSAGKVAEAPKEVGRSAGDAGVSPSDAGDSAPRKVAETPKEVGKSTAGDAAQSPYDVEDSSAGKVAESPYDVDDSAAGKVAKSPYDVDDSSTGNAAKSPHDVAQSSGGVESSPFTLPSSTFDAPAPPDDGFGVV